MVGRLRPEQCILEGVDGRCGAFDKPLAPIWKVMFEIDPSLKAVDFRALEDWVQCNRSWVNTCYGFGSARSHQPDWHRVADAAAERIIAEAVLKWPCPVPLTVRGTQTLVSFAPLAFKLFYAARQNAVLRRSSFPSP